MVKMVEIQAEIDKTEFLKHRTRFTTNEEEEKAFSTLSRYRDGGIFAGGFSGESAWERHSQGDEMVQVLDGEADLTILEGNTPEVLHIQKGMLVVVPKGLWHRFHAPQGVTLMTVTPEPTDISTLDYPPDEGQ
ncbi:MAG: cupin domain-containing protein [Gammaproteobacteria bacterium]|nr:cupin domain-containing protein [Gammaproteobacteria bacterium]